MKFKKILKCSLAVALVFGTTSFLTGCGNDDSSVKDTKQYEIYKMALDSGATDLSYEDWLVSIKGAKGDKGDAGHTPVIAIGNNGNWYIDGVDTQVKATGATGSAGAAGTQWKTGTIAPTSTTAGENGDFYFDTVTQTIYRKENGNWVVKATISDGQDGREILFQTSSTHIQWKYEGENTWHDLIPLSSLKGTEGDAGKQVELRVEGENIEWRYEDGTWATLIAIDELKGDKGDPGEDGVSVVSVATSADKWGIKITNTFTLSDETTQETFYTVVDEFRTYSASSEEDIVALLNYGVSKIGLDADVELTRAIIVDRNLTFNLNDHEISIPTDRIGDGVFYVPAGGNLTIEGDGIVNGASEYNDYGMVVWADGGDVTINGGTFTNVGTKTYEDNGTTRNNNEVIYVKNGGRVTINGGEFIGENPRWTLNSHNINKGVIVVNGGRFYGEFDPSYANTEDDGANVFVNYLGFGCRTEKMNGYYLDVIQEVGHMYGAIAVKNERDLLRAIEQNASMIYLTKDIEVSTAIVIDNGDYITVNLNGKKISAPNDTVGDGIFYVTGGGALQIEGQGIVDAASLKNDYSMAVWALNGGMVRINGGIYTNVGAKSIDKEDNVNNNEVIYVRGGGMVEINGGTFIGNNSRWVLNSRNDDPGQILVNAGTFIGFDPSNANTDDAGPDNNPINYVNSSSVVNTVTNKGTTAYVVTSNNVGESGGGEQYPDISEVNGTRYVLNNGEGISGCDSIILDSDSMIAYMVSSDIIIFSAKYLNEENEYIVILIENGEMPNMYLKIDGNSLNSTLSGETTTYTYQVEAGDESITMEFRVSGITGECLAEFIYDGYNEGIFMVDMGEDGSTLTFEGMIFDIDKDTNTLTMRVLPEPTE